MFFFFYCLYPSTQCTSYRYHSILQYILVYNVASQCATLPLCEVATPPVSQVHVSFTYNDGEFLVSVRHTSPPQMAISCAVISPHVKVRCWCQRARPFFLHVKQSAQYIPLYVHVSRVRGRSKCPGRGCSRDTPVTDAWKDPCK